MIRVSRTNPEIFTGWLSDYLRATSGTRFPISFQALCGIFTLSSIVGRRCGLHRPGYKLWPPTSILLLGESGVGKTSCINIAYEIIDTAIVTDDRPEFVLKNVFEATTSGLQSTWAQQQADRGIGFLEGSIMADELKSILAKRTGTDNAAQFLIRCCEHRHMTTMTQGRGEVTVKNLTVAFAFGSTVQYMRSAVSIDDFGGGLMHRFLIAHEWKKTRGEEREVSPEDIRTLAEKARSIWNNAPENIEVEDAANSRLLAFRNIAEDKKFPSRNLAGFWNRYDGLITKVAMTFALSDGVYKITTDHVDRAEGFLRRSIYPPMDELVMELSFGTRERTLYNIGDDLWGCGEEGLPLKIVLMKLPGTSRTAKLEALEVMKMLGLAKSIGENVIHPGISDDA